MQPQSNKRSRPHLEYLLQEAMARVVPTILEKCRTQWFNSGRSGEPDRSTLVQVLMQEVGARRFVELCESFASNIPPSPLMFLLFNSSTPAEFIRKINAHSSHFHHLRRLELTHEDEGFIVVEDIVVAGEHSTADDVFVSSILKVGLHELGCRGINVIWEAVRSHELKATLEELGISPIAIEGVTRWRITWNTIESQTVIRGMDDFFLDDRSPMPKQQAASLIMDIIKLLKSELSRRPSMKVIAAKLGVSTRTLQRRLGIAGTTYSTLYNDIRIQTAEKLLCETDMKLTEIAQLAGFNDNAHLCREFKKHHHTTPTQFRRQAG